MSGDVHQGIWWGYKSEFYSACSVFLKQFQGRVSKDFPKLHCHVGGRP